MSKAKKRFIDANALKKAIDHTGVDMLESADYFGFTYKKIMRMIDDAPTADVAPVVNGCWVLVDTNEEQFFVCSKCGKKEYWESDYCPNCGAKMDGAENSNNQKGAQE